MTSLDDSGIDRERLVALSYHFCREVCRAAKSNFPLTFRLLSPPKRRAMEALYAFFRFSDNLVDESKDVDLLEMTRLWRQWVSRALSSTLPREKFLHELCHSRAASSLLAGLLILTALKDTVDAYNIPHSCLLALLDGMERDAAFKPFGTFAELEVYCDQVASSVGRACLHIWGFLDEKALQLAHQCGMAFQLTNILRDVREDAERGRVYFPLDELAQFKCDPLRILEGRVTPEWSRYLDWQFQRTEEYYRHAANILPLVEREGRPVYGMMFSTYWRLFQNIRQKKSELFRKRVSLKHWQSLAIILRWIIWPPRRLPGGGQPSVQNMDFSPTN